MTDFRFRASIAKDQFDHNGGLIYTFREENFVWALSPDTPSPVILSVPHDGLPANDLLDFRLDINQTDSANFNRDGLVWTIAKKIASRVPVTVIRGMFPRCLVDYNRSWPEQPNGRPEWQEADLNEKNGKRLWQSYYDFLDVAIERSIYDFGKEKVLLLDLHGFTARPDERNEVILGTWARETVNSDIDMRLMAYLSSLHIRAHASEIGACVSSDHPYGGGNIIHQCHSTHSVDCIQVEIEQAYRSMENQYRMHWLIHNLSEFIKLLI